MPLQTLPFWLDDVDSSEQTGPIIPWQKTYVAVRFRLLHFLRRWGNLQDLAWHQARRHGGPNLPDEEAPHEAAARGLFALWPEIRRLDKLTFDRMWMPYSGPRRADYVAAIRKLQAQVAHLTAAMPDISLAEMARELPELEQGFLCGRTDPLPYGPFESCTWDCPCPECVEGWEFLGFPGAPDSRPNPATLSRLKPWAGLVRKPGPAGRRRKVRDSKRTRRFGRGR